MFGINKNEVINDILDELKIKELAFTFLFNKTEYFACTCGYCQTFDNKQPKICPKCNTPYLVDGIDFEGDTIPLIYKPNIIRNDESYFILTINVVTLKIDTTTYTKEEYDSDEYHFVYFLYDKKKKKFFIVERDYYYEDTFIYGNDFEYKEDGIYCDGEIIGTFVFLDDEYYNYPHSKNLFEINGMKDCLSILANEMNIDISGYLNQNECYYDEIIYEFFVHNIKWHNDFIELSKNYEIKNFGFTSTRDFLSNYFDFMENGVNMEATTFEEAFGLSVEIMASLSTFSAYKKAKPFIKTVYDSGLSEIGLKWMEEIPYYQWGSVLELATETNQSLYTVVRHIHIGMVHGFSVTTILNTDFEMLKHGHKELCNVSIPFNPKLVRKWNFVKKGIMDGIQYDLIVKKPTLDNVIKVLNI